MKRIINNNIQCSLNSNGKEDILYETLDEFKKAFRGASDSLIQSVRSQFNWSSSVIGVVKSDDFEEDYPKMIRVYASETSKFKVVSSHSIGSITKYVDEPVQKETILKRRLL